MALFGKIFGNKNKADAGDDGEPAVNKGGALGRIKKKLKISISLKKPPKPANEEEVPEIGLRSGFTDDDQPKQEDPENKKKVKAKKEKKPKEPREKKPKKEKPPKKEKKPREKSPEDTDEADGEETKGKRRKLMIFIIAGAGVAVGAAAFAVYAFVFRGPSLEEQLMSALLMLNEMKYDEAEAAFADIVEKYDDSVDAYLGLADAKLGKADEEGALQALDSALAPTGNDQLILDKIEEISGGDALPDGSPGSSAEGTPPPTETPITFVDAAFGDMLRTALGKNSGEPVSQLELADITTLKILGATHAAIKRGSPYESAGSGASTPRDISAGPNIPESEALAFGPEPPGSYAALSFGARPAPVLLYGSEPPQTPVSEAPAGTEEAPGGDMRWTAAPVGAEAGVSSENVLEAINSLDGYTIDGVKHTERGGITSLEDLKNFRSLKKLTIGYNSIDDLAGIEGLAGLDTLGLYCNDIADLSPVAGLSGLKYVYLYNNRISDISPVEGLAGIEDMWLNYNQISDVAPLGKAAGLHTLHIDHNQISDISPLAELSKLYVLGAAGNQISDVSALGGLRNLSSVDLTGNPVADYSPVADIFNLTR